MRTFSHAVNFFVGFQEKLLTRKGKDLCGIFGLRAKAITVICMWKSYRHRCSSLPFGEVSVAYMSKKARNPLG